MAEPRLREIHLYDEGTAPTLRVEEVASYLVEVTRCETVETHRSFLLEQAPPEQWPGLARRLAGLKVLAVDSPWREREPTHGEVEFERRRLAKGDRGPHGVVYEGFELQRAMREMMGGRGGGGGSPCDIPRLLCPVGVEKPALPRAAGMGMPALQVAHIAFTNRLVATWGEDGRYHLRTIILGIPAIISATGLVEAPAKPREFYLAQQQLGPSAQSEYALAQLKEQFHGRFLDHDDPRLTEVAKGYAMQAIAYLLTGEAFCDDPDCRLFNAHWQEEMLRAQTAEREQEYCQRHRALLAARRGEGE